MKKLFGILIILVVIFSLVACNNGKEEQINQNMGDNVQETKKEFDYIDAENVGKYTMVQTIELPENPTTGYICQYDIKDSSVVVSVNSEYIPDTTEQIVGSGGKRIFSFQGIKEGESEIEFRNERPFEDGSSIKTLRYVFSVNADKKIAIIDQIYE